MARLLLCLLSVFVFHAAFVSALPIGSTGTNNAVQCALIANISGNFPCDRCSALLISFRFNENQVVFDSRRDGVWDIEERRVSPVKKWQKFNLNVNLVNDGFKINIDQYWNAFYYSRLPYWEISDVSVNGSGYVALNYFEDQESTEDIEELAFKLKTKKK